MLYAILCYHHEDVVQAWSKDEHDTTMANLRKVTEKLSRQGRLGPVARLLPTTTATTLRKDQEPPLVVDGPFAETKEQLLGFYVIDCASLDEAIETARELARKEGMFVGISAGGTFAGALRVARTAPAGSVILAMLPDTGERYLSTFLFEGVTEGTDEEWPVPEAEKM